MKRVLNLYPGQHRCCHAFLDFFCGTPVTSGRVPPREMWQALDTQMFPAALFSEMSKLPPPRNLQLPRSDKWSTRDWWFNSARTLREPHCTVFQKKLGFCPNLPHLVPSGGWFSGDQKYNPAQKGRNCSNTTALITPLTYGWSRGPDRALNQE